MTTENSYRNLYLKYLETQGVTLEPELLKNVDKIIANVKWEEPENVADYQAIAVIAMIEAEMSENMETRCFYVDMALQSLDTAVKMGQPSLAIAQWALIQSRLGDLSNATKVAFHDLLTTAEAVYLAEHSTSQLVYIPSKSPGSSGLSSAEILNYFLSTRSLETQRLALAAEAFCRSQLVLYNVIGARALRTLAHFFPHSVDLQRKLGVYQLADRELEGFIPLHKSNSVLAKKDSGDTTLCATLALQLAAQQYQSTARAEFWKKQAQVIRSELAKENPAWLHIPAEDPCIYLPYDDDICFAAEPTLNSIVTRVLLAEGDWFELEMELWRSLIRPGMTIIDVGANSGVYTFSAAKRVGSSGTVIAIEPFKGCVTNLNLTREKNGFEWVRICEAAASSKPGQSTLRLQGASELNELQFARSGEDNSSATQQVDCITLDSLIEREELSQVDLIKIDAEGHEVAVLEGSQELISQFMPTILYENIAGSQGSNQFMAQALLQQGYKLFRYRAFVQQLIPVNPNDENLEDSLNLFAIAESRLSEMSAWISE